VKCSYTLQTFLLFHLSRHSAGISIEQPHKFMQETLWFIKAL